MEDFEKRMVIEYKELEERTNKLNAFLNYDENADKRKNVCAGQLDLMHKQLEAMKVYLDALGARLQIRGVCFNGCNVNELKGWHKFSEELPHHGVPVIAYHHLWVNEDFNPWGIREGFLMDNLAADSDVCKYDFCSAHWWDYQDCYMTISKIEIEGHEQEYSDEIKKSIIPEYWIEMPKFNSTTDTLTD